MKSVKRYVTMLELLVVIAFFALTLGAVAFNIRAFYVEQKTLSEMEQIVNVLNTASNLMSLVNLDTNVGFVQDSVALIPKSSVPEIAAPLLSKKPLHLNYIQEIYFEDAFIDKILTPPFYLQFMSKGFIMNRGILWMKGQGVTRAIVFPGYPKHLVLDANEKLIFPHDQNLQSLIENLQEELLREIQEASSS